MNRGEGQKDLFPNCRKCARKGRGSWCALCSFVLRDSVLPRVRHTLGTSRSASIQESADKAVAEDEAAFRSHVEQKICDAEVGEEAGAVGEDLIVGRRMEGGVSVGGCFGRDDFAEVKVAGTGSLIVRAFLNVAVQFEEFNHQLVESAVQVGQQAEVRVKHAFEIVGVELKKRTALIRRDECVPMQVSPVPVGRDLNFADTAAPVFVSHHGDGERKHSLRRGDAAAIAVGLLHIVLVDVHHGFAGCIESGVEVNGSKIGGAEDNHSSKTILPTRAE